MGKRDLEALRQARENFVRKRRDMAEQMIPSGAAAAHFSPGFAEIQAAIEAIDRAMVDEAALPEGYGVDQIPHLDRKRSNVEKVDFENR